MGIRFSCSHDASENPDTPTDYQKDLVSTSGSPWFLNHSDLTLLFAIDLWDQKLQLRTVQLNFYRFLVGTASRLSLLDYFLYIHLLDQVYKPGPSTLLRRSHTIQYVVPPIERARSPLRWLQRSRGIEVTQITLTRVLSWLGYCLALGSPNYWEFTMLYVHILYGHDKIF